MQRLLRFVGLANAFGLLAAVSVFLAGAWLSPFLIWLLAASLIVSPAHVLFIATAACEPFDWCSVSTLLWVVALNAVVYTIVGIALWFTSVRGPLMRVAVLAVAAVVSVLWVRVWV